MTTGLKADGINITGAAVVRPAVDAAMSVAAPRVKSRRLIFLVIEVS
jgi:hypothetical protein